MTRLPVRLFRSPLTGRIYALTHYRTHADGTIENLGEKDDVTADYETLVAFDLAALKAEVQAGIGRPAEGSGT